MDFIFYFTVVTNLPFVLQHFHGFNNFLYTNSKQLNFITFTIYSVKELGAHGTFAGNDAIVAFARNNCCDINIHQLSALVWTVSFQFNLFNLRLL